MHIQLIITQQEYIIFIYALLNDVPVYGEEGINIVLPKVNLDFFRKAYKMV